MTKITVEEKKLMQILKGLEKANDQFCNFICHLDPCLLDEDEALISKIGKSLDFCRSKLDGIVYPSEKTNS